MKPASGQAGYTIVETMIFLLISSVLLAATVGMFSARISRTQFTQSVQELAAKITTTSNEAASGTYPDNPSFDCDNVGGKPTVSPLISTDNQGSRDPCVFVGKIMNFTPAGVGDCADPITSHSCEDVDIYTVVGRREVSNTDHTPITSLFGVNGANPTIVETADVNLTQRYHLNTGTHVTATYLRLVDNSLKYIDSIGFFQYGTIGSLGSGAQVPGMWALNPSATPLAPSTAADNNATLRTPPAPFADPSAGMLVCLKSGNGDQKASIGLGINNTSFVAKVTIGDSRCPS